MIKKFLGMSRRKKIAILVPICIIILLLAYSIFWFSVVNSKYDSFIKKGFEKEKILTSFFNKSYIYTDEKTGDLYYIKLPNTLRSFTGNLSLSLGEDLDKKSEDNLFIWPGIFTKTTYGLMLEDENGETWQIMVDKNGNLIEKNPTEQKVLDEKKDKIKELFSKARLIWEI